MTSPEKARRLGERVKAVVSQKIPSLKDPRIGFVTVTEVRMSRDNELATVYYTVLPDTAEERDRAAAGLQSAKGTLRRELGNVLHVRHVPDLVFAIDDVADSGRRIEQILAGLDDAGEQGDDNAGDGDG